MKSQRAAGEVRLTNDCFCPEMIIFIYLIYLIFIISRNDILCFDSLNDDVLFPDISQNQVSPRQVSALDLTRSGTESQPKIGEQLVGSTCPSTRRTARYLPTYIASFPSLGRFRRSAEPGAVALRSTAISRISLRELPGA